MKVFYKGNHEMRHTLLKRDFDKIKESGMLWELYPGSPGIWEEGFKEILPRNPPVGLLESMAMRSNHAFGLLEESEKKVHLTTMKQIYEECSGHGFYKWI